MQGLTGDFPMSLKDRYRTIVGIRFDLVLDRLFNNSVESLKVQWRHLFQISRRNEGGGDFTSSPQGMLSRTRDSVGYISSSSSRYISWITLLLSVTTVLRTIRSGSSPSHTGRKTANVDLTGPSKGFIRVSCHWPPGARRLAAPA